MIYSHLLIQVRHHNHGAVIPNHGCKLSAICLGAIWRYFLIPSLVKSTDIVETGAAVWKKEKNDETISKV